MPFKKDHGKSQTTEVERKKPNALQNPPNLEANLWHLLTCRPSRVYGRESPPGQAAPGQLGPHHLEELTCLPTASLDTSSHHCPSWAKGVHGGFY